MWHLQKPKDSFISNFRPKAEIITFTTKDKTLNQLNLLWGVEQFPIERKETFSEMLKSANDFLIKEKNIIKVIKLLLLLVHLRMWKQQQI